jgi:hypothetical protein
MSKTELKTETFDIGGQTFRATLYPDDCPPSPREHATFGILCLPRMTRIEDKSAPDISGPNEFWQALASMAAGRKFHAHKREIEEEIRQRTAGALSGEDGPSWDQTRDLHEEKEEHIQGVARDLALTEYTVSNVYKKEHGRIKLSLGPFSSRWDSGQVGWIYARRSVAADRLFAEDRDPTDSEIEEKARRTFENELDVLSTWLNGEVVGFRLFGPDGDEVDACWGFYEWSYALDEARQMAEVHLDKRPA